MDFRLSAEQGMLRDAARRFVLDRLDFSARGVGGLDPATSWAAIAEMGWLALPVPEDCDGLGGCAEDMVILAEELGRGAAPEPFVEGAVLSARLIDLAGTPKQRQELLPALGAGTLRFAAALQEHQRWTSSSLTTRLSHTDNGYLLSGTKCMVIYGQHADRLIISAEFENTLTLCVVDANAVGVERRDYASIDGRSFSDFSFDAVAVSKEHILCAKPDLRAVVDRAVDEAIIGICADALGGIDKMLEMTASYLRIRSQFGQPLADFQALQHGMANLYIEAMDARSILYAALSKIDAAAPDRRAAVSACKLKIGEAARTISGMAVHYHGGIGMTTENAVGRYLQRALVFEQMFGNGQDHFQSLFDAEA
jgi:alkylation response protein AidB-like acyl-CoA dehydrogenase